jgi:hypothetical protein
MERLISWSLMQAEPPEGDVTHICRLILQWGGRFRSAESIVYRIDSSFAIFSETDSGKCTKRSEITFAPDCKVQRTFGFRECA